MEQINKETKETIIIFLNFVLNPISKFSKMISSGSGAASKVAFLT